MTHIESMTRHFIDQRRWTRLPIILAAALTLGVSATAQQQQCFVDSVPLQNTNWNKTVTFSKFDPALGDLVSVSFKVDSEVHGSAAAENKDAAPAMITLSFQNFITLQRPDTSILTVANPQANFNDVLGAYDGVDDFAGTSGVTHAGIVAIDSQTSISPPPATDLPLFTGPLGNPGTITLPIKATGASSGSGAGNLLASFVSQAQATVTVCYNYVGNTPPQFTSPGCGITLMASVGVPFSVNVCATDSNANEVVTLSATSMPAGATTTPVLPTSGPPPVCATVNWTPLSNQIGVQTFSFVAVDTHGRSSSCSFSVLVAECHLIIGAGYGNTQFPIFGHLYNTQMRVVRLSFPVTTTAMPNIRLPLNHAMWAQVVMYNPQVFPTNPSQWSRLAKVIMHGDGTMTTDWYGNSNGINLDAITVVDPFGLTRVRFPFTIDGM